MAVYGDLGRTPLFVDIVLAVLNYFRRLEEINSGSLLGQTFNSSKEIHTSGKESWYSGVLFIIQQLNINANMSLHEIKSKLIKRSMELWGKQLHENAVIEERKLHTYNTFKQIFKCDPYRNVVNFRDVRKSFTRFRVSAHDLAIERGRYKNIKSENRICKNC